MEQTQSDPDMGIDDVDPCAMSRDASTDQVGTFRFDMRDRTLNWSDSLYEIYGYEPGSVRPTVELVLERCHPDDRARAENILANLLATGQGCVHAHRIVTRSGEIRYVVIVGSSVRDDSGEIDHFAGYTVDVTHRTEVVVAESVTDALSNVVESRAVIEQAKGALMLAFGVDAATAFGVLSWQSQLNNVKLRVLAAQIMTDIRGRGALTVDLQDSIGNLLLTAHERLQN